MDDDPPRVVLHLPSPGRRVVVHPVYECAVPGCPHPGPALQPHTHDRADACAWCGQVGGHAVLCTALARELLDGPGSC